MLQEKFHRILMGKVFAALEIFEMRGNIQYAIVIAKEQGGEVQVIQSAQEDTLEALLPFLKNKPPLLLSINTRKVLSKQLSSALGTPPEGSVMQAFPNLDLETFYYQLWTSSKKTLVSIGQKTLVEHYINELKALDLHPVQINLGATSLQSLENSVTGIFYGTNFSVEINSNGLDKYQKTTEYTTKKTTLQGVTLTAFSLLGFSQIIGFLQQRKVPGNLDVTNHSYYELFLNERRFRYGVHSALLFFLVVLLGNFFFFQFYFESSQALELKLAQTTNQAEVLAQLKDKVATKEERLERIESLEQTKTAQLFNTIGQSIPPSISLETMIFQPLAKPRRARKEIELISQEITLSGGSQDKMEFSNWIRTLETHPLIKKVGITDYRTLQKEKAAFQLTIQLTHDQEK